MAPGAEGRGVDEAKQLTRQADVQPHDIFEPGEVEIRLWVSLISRMHVIFETGTCLPLTISGLAKK